MPLKANYHTHTTFCDGQSTAEEMVNAAIELDFYSLGFSGHMDPDVQMNWNEYIEEIQRLQKEYKDRLEILAGVELDILYSGKPISINPITPINLNSSINSIGQPLNLKCDYIIGSTHFLDLPPINGINCAVDISASLMHEIANEYYSGDFYALSKAYYDLEAKISEKIHPDFIGHFDLVTCFNDLKKEDGGQFLDEENPKYLNPALEAMEYLCKQGIPFEINMGSVNRGRKKEPFPSLKLLKALRDFGGEILISSDAHDYKMLNAGFAKAVRFAIAAGFTHTNVLTKNTKNKGGKIEWRQIALDTL